MIDVSTPGRAQRHHVEFVMGMAVSIDIRNEVETTVVDEAVAWLHHVDATFSTHNQDSPISAMGRGRTHVRRRQRRNQGGPAPL